MQADRHVPLGVVVAQNRIAADPARARELEETLLGLVARLEEEASPEPGPALDEEALERLRALGYVR